MPISSYFVDFTAHIDERKRPENFPHEVHDKKVLDVESVPHLQHEVNKRFVELVSSSGLVVLKDDLGIIEEGRISFEKRVFIPWHMITHMDLRVELLPVRPVVQDLIIPGHSLPEPPTERAN